MQNKNKKGMSFIEAIVAIAIFLLGMIGFSMLASRTWRMNSFIIEEGNATAEATKAINTIVKDLRKVRQADDGTYPIASLGTHELSVYLDDDGDGITERIHYFLSGENLMKGITKPTSNPVTYPSGDDETVILAKYITNTAAQPLYYYYNKDYPGDTTNNPLSNPAIADVRLIQIHVWVNIKPLIAPENINLTSFVELRNLNENQ